ncbi:MAG: hypothetical protein NPIRA05_16880 [Nitrospirales bacterium]|nr:MAG: hypothetical protein NPIRA05_16880 [Nitrospirales bacterium]
MSDNNSQYDRIGSKYDDYSRTATLKWIERHTISLMVEGIDGARALDLACGLGFYTRLLQPYGAGQVIGVDISPEMIPVVSQHEVADPPGMIYHGGNELEPPDLGFVHLIAAIWLLNDAKTKNERLHMFRISYDKLNEESRFVAFALNPAFDFRTVNFIKYGCSYTKTGFREFAWHAPEGSPDDVKLYGQEYWQDFYTNCHGIGLICKKELNPLQHRKIDVALSGSI